MPLCWSRYNRRPRFRIADAQVGAQRFAATFDADAPQALQQVLEGTPGLLLEKRGDEIVIRSRRPDAVDGSEPQRSHDVESQRRE